MQFTRQNFYDINSQGLTRDIGSVRVHANFTNLIKEQGFVNLDGSELSGTEAANTFRWKYDTESVKNKTYWYYNSTNNIDNYRFTSGTNTVSTYSNFVSIWPSFPSCCVFFVPTKNNGFYTVNYSFRGYYGYTCPTPALFSFSKEGTTRYGTTNEQFRYGGCLCFFNNVTNEWNYISKDAGAPVGEGIYLDDRSRGAESANTKLSIDTDGTKTDVKEGVCTLIKPPYNNGFLSNIYMVSTSPTRGTNDANGTDNKFFSFNGRNFYGFYHNMVVELPAN